MIPVPTKAAIALLALPAPISLAGNDGGATGISHAALLILAGADTRAIVRLRAALSNTMCLSRS